MNAIYLCWTFSGLRKRVRTFEKSMLSSV